MARVTTGGGEHHVFYEKGAKRVVKITRGTGVRLGAKLDLSGKYWTLGRGSVLDYYIKNKGGKVVAITGLNAIYGGTNIRLSDETFSGLKRTFDHERLLEILTEANVVGSLEALTEGEGLFILALSADGIRDRIAEARRKAYSEVGEGPVSASKAQINSKSKNTSDDTRFQAGELALC